jgi:hypothetical protein
LVAHQEPMRNTQGIKRAEINIAKCTLLYSHMASVSRAVRSIHDSTRKPRARQLLPNVMARECGPPSWVLHNATIYNRIRGVRGGLRFSASLRGYA